MVEVKLKLTNISLEKNSLNSFELTFIDENKNTYKYIESNKNVIFEDSNPNHSTYIEKRIKAIIRCLSPENAYNEETLNDFLNKKEIIKIIISEKPKTIIANELFHMLNKINDEDIPRGAKPYNANPEYSHANYLLHSDIKLYSIFKIIWNKLYKNKVNK